MYLYGQGVTKDAQEAVKWFRKAAEQGDDRAQQSLGWCYFGGEGVQKDFQESLHWYLKAAEQGNTDAMNGVGIAYDFGFGVNKDQAEAVKWWRRAAALGDQGAQESLGWAYETGQGVERDYMEALRLYKNTAEQGSVLGQSRLGLLYANGKGVPPNDIEAYKWLSLAAAQGFDMAAELRDSVSERMARAEIVEGQRRAAAFVAKKESRSPEEVAPPPASVPRSGLFDDLVRPEERAQPSGTGTGFFVTSDGCFLTCQHVVENAIRMEVQIGSKRFSARLLKVDKVNDIAVLKVSGAFDALRLAVNHGAKLGESVFTVGFPNIELQGLEPKYTRGEISSIAGAQDDPRHFQISVAVQPGNSGGPLVNRYGNVVGIVTARLSDLGTLKATGALPQNVNYAIKAAYASALLESLPEVTGRLKEPYPASERKLEDVVKEAQKATALVLVY